jgi:hypothetical protein
MDDDWYDNSREGEAELLTIWLLGTEVVRRPITRATDAVALRLALEEDTW